MSELAKPSNILTLLRLLSIIPLWILAVLGLNRAFGIVYALAVLTDALDGFVARRLKQASAFGAWFDSLADNLLGLSLFAWLWLLLPEFLGPRLWIVVLLAMLVVNIAAGFIRYRRLVSMHLYSMKASFALVALFAVVATIGQPNVALFWIAAVSTAAGLLEEFLCIIRFKEMRANRKSLFSGNARS